VRVAEQKIIGKDESHLKITVDSPALPRGIKGVGWRWAEYYPLPDRLDIAYKLRENKWQGKTNIEIELVSARIPVEVNDLPPPTATKSARAKKSNNPATQSFNFQDREYQCLLANTGQELKIWNADGQILTATKGQKKGTLVSPSGQTKEINVTEPHFFQLIKAAMVRIDS
jgi:single-stranded-DNA-specific exonuclease